MTSPATPRAPAHRPWPALALAVLALALGWAVFGLDAGDRGRKVAVPPDLGWIPPDAALFLQLRPADLWASAPARVLRRRFDEDTARIARDVKQELGIALPEIESVILVFSSLGDLTGRGRVQARAEGAKAILDFARDKAIKDGPPRPKDRPDGSVKDSALPRGLDGAVRARVQPGVGQDGRDDPPSGHPALFIVTADAKEVARLREQVAQHGKEHRHKGKIYYTTGEGPVGPSQAVHFVNERTYVRGHVRAVKAGLERGARAEASGPLVPALEKAMKKHHLVVGLQLSGEAIRDLGELLNNTPEPGVRRALAPLAATRSAALWADAGKQTRATAELHFGDEHSARRGLDAAQDGLALLRIHALGGLIAQVEEEVEDADEKNRERVFFGLLCLERLEAALRAVKAEREGATIRLAAAADTDLEALDGQVAAALKARAGDEHAQKARARRKSVSNLKQIGLALHNLNDTYRYLPPATILDKQTGRPLLSWRVAVLPYIEQAPLYQQFKLDEAWDSAHNKKLLEKMPAVYAPVGVKTKEPHATFYRGFVASKGARFATAWQSVRNPNSPFGGWGARIPASFPDGTSNTLWVVEAGEAVPWTKPEELVYEENRPLPKLGGMFREGFHALMVDGSVTFVSNRYDERTLRNFITANDGQVVDPDRLR